MAIIPKSFDDTLLDSIVTALKAFETTQRVQDSKVFFRVEREMLRPPTMRDMPLVNIWAERITPNTRKTSGKLYGHDTISINADCYAKGLDLGGDSDTIDDSIAIKRLCYLKEQVRYGLYQLINSDFGYQAGTIAVKSWPTWQLFQNELKLPETELVAGRWSFDVEYAWSPEDIGVVDLDQITVDAEIWGANYNY